LNVVSNYNLLWFGTAMGLFVVQSKPTHGYCLRFWIEQFSRASRQLHVFASHIDWFIGLSACIDLVFISLHLTESQGIVLPKGIASSLNG